MTQLQTEDSLSFATKGPELVKSVVEMVVDAVIEWKVIRYIVLISEDICFKLFYFLQPKERNAKLFFFILFLWKKLRFLIYASYKPQYFYRFALEGDTYLLHKIILHWVLEILKQFINYFSDVLVLIRSGRLIPNKISVDDIGLHQLRVGSQKIMKDFFFS